MLFCSPLHIHFSRIKHLLLALVLKKGKAKFSNIFAWELDIFKSPAIHRFRLNIQRNNILLIKCMQDKYFIRWTGQRSWIQILYSYLIVSVRIFLEILFPIKKYNKKSNKFPAETETISDGYSNWTTSYPLKSRCTIPPPFTPHCDLQVLSSRAKTDNFVTYFLNNKANIKCFIVLKVKGYRKAQVI